MNYFDKTILLIIIMIFPNFIYLFCVAYYKNAKNEERNIYHSIANITTLYLTIKYIKEFISGTLIFTFIPIIISYNKNKSKEAIVLSIILSLYFIYTGEPFILIIPLILLFITNKFINNDKIKYIMYNIIPIVFMLNNNIYMNITFMFVLLIECLFLEMAEDFIKYHNDYNELIKEEQIASSLFKITHEIKNPLAVCVGYLDMLDEKDFEKYKKYTKIIESEINRTLVILSDFSNLSKITINQEIMDINMLLEEVVDKIKIITKEKNIDIKLELNEEELYINGDYNRLNQVIINVIKNSVEAINNNGLIKIKSKQQNNNIIVEIIDNGVGMSENTLKNITVPFFTTKSSGTGLGVPLSKEIIKKHNGSIEYNSNKNEGTKVTITIPEYKSLDAYNYT